MAFDEIAVYIELLPITPEEMLELRKIYQPDAHVWFATYDFRGDRTRYRITASKQFEIMVSGLIKPQYVAFRNYDGKIDFSGRILGNGLAKFTVMIQNGILQKITRQVE